MNPSRASLLLAVLFLGTISTLLIDIAIGLMGGSVGKILSANKRVQSTGKWLTGSVFISLSVGTALFGDRRA